MKTNKGKFSLILGLTEDQKKEKNLPEVLRNLKLVTCVPHQFSKFISNQASIRASITACLQKNPGPGTLYLKP